MDFVAIHEDLVLRQFVAIPFHPPDTDGNATSQTPQLFSVVKRQVSVLSCPNETYNPVSSSQQEHSSCRRIL